MMLTPGEITSLVSKPLTGVTRGRAMALERRERRQGSVGTQRTREFLAQMAAAPVPTLDTYTHPAVGYPQRLDSGPLSPAEMAWLERLPREPAQITFDDAQALASLSASISSMKNRSDRRLVDSVWTPVKELHDRNAAQVQLRNAQRTPTTIPNALPALADAIAAAEPSLEPGEAIGRAGRALESAQRSRLERREQAIFDADSTLHDLDASIERRTAVTR